MNPIAEYRFKKSADTATRYLLDSHKGVKIPNFPAVYKVGVNKGKQYIGFRKTADKNGKQYDRYSHMFELAGNTTFTGVNFTESEPYRTYGDSRNLNRNDCILIEFMGNNEIITMYFYEGQANNAKKLFKEWVEHTTYLDFSDLEKEHEEVIKNLEEEVYRYDDV